MFEIELYLGTELTNTVNVTDQTLGEARTLARVMYADYAYRNPGKQVFVWINDDKGRVVFAINEDND